jgi:hypothetical protein
MKIYETKLSSQNLGSSTLIILRGTVSAINETFNSFYNLSGTSEGAKIDINDNGENSIGTFWTTEALMRRYWQNRFLYLNPNIKDKLVYNNECEDANLYVSMNIAEMRQHPEAFMNFDKSYLNDGYQMGKISAEKNDFSFKEAAHAHVSKAQE